MLSTYSIVPSKSTNEAGIIVPGSLIAIDEVKEPENNFEDAIEHMYNMPQNDKRIEFGTTISVAKTSVQVTRLNAQESQSISHSDIEISKTLSNLDNKQHSLDNISNLPKTTNLEYYKPSGYPPKCLKLFTKENNNLCILLSLSKTCSYYQEKEYNIKGCKKQKIDKENNKY
ncbi:9907_t:CDS:2 [Gigaspora margarita]|uniref:9907_t:CDS:1 n=1 Tax=Gigaspora margarita TaxID=4874 RepID=A0ABN7UVN0_GIGMA|nr:9907_t:CDS:2 [Gigaspora margarita]